MDFAIVWAALSIGIAWLWVTLGEWLIAKKSLDVLWKNPDLWPVFKPLTILWIALTESAAIYWLVIGLLILFAGDFSSAQWIAAWLSIGLAWFAAWLWEWWVAAQALESILRNPDAQWEIRSNMILYIAMVESAAIYALVISLLILFA